MYLFLRVRNKLNIVTILTDAVKVAKAPSLKLPAVNQETLPSLAARAKRNKLFKDLRKKSLDNLAFAYNITAMLP